MFVAKTMLNTARVCMVSLSLLGALNACSITSPSKQANNSVTQPILEVKQGPYSFAMYPDAQSNEAALLKLDIRDARGEFVHGASVSANLAAQDGYLEKCVFTEDQVRERYIAKLSLKHHEDYTVSTLIQVESQKYNPKFVFHAGDIIPDSPHEFHEKQKEEVAK